MGSTNNVIFFFASTCLLLCLLASISDQSNLTSTTARALASQQQGDNNDDAVNDDSNKIQFSVLVKPTAKITAVDLEPLNYGKGDSTSKAYYLYRSVVDATTTLLCQKTDFEMVINGSDSCVSTSSDGKRQYSNIATTTTNHNATTYSTQFEADLEKVDVAVNDGLSIISIAANNSTTTTLIWLEFAIHYPILQTPTDTYTTKKEAYQAAQNIIQKAINDNTFANQLIERVGNGNIVAVANIGYESTMFFPWVQLWGLTTNNYDDDATTHDDATTTPPIVTNSAPPQPQKSLFHHEFFNPIRIAGLSLLFITIVVVTTMMCLAQQRKKFKLEKKFRLEEEEQEEENLTSSAGEILLPQTYEV